jgi:hypothetical protein
MPKLSHAVILTAVLAATPAFAGADTKVLDHHVANMKSGHLEAVLSDYAPDAVVVAPGIVTPDGVYVGSEIRKLFSVLTGKDNLPGNKTMQTRYENAGADTTIMRWVQFKGTAKEVSGYDGFVTRGGKIAYQTVVVNPAKK